jgi:hypothetical protein
LSWLDLALLKKRQLLPKKQIFCDERAAAMRRKNGKADQVNDDQRHSPSTVFRGEKKE